MRPGTAIQAIYITKYACRADHSKAGSRLVQLPMASATSRAAAASTHLGPTHGAVVEPGMKCCVALQQQCLSQFAIDQD